MPNRCSVCGIKINSDSSCSNCFDLEINKITTIRASFYLMDAAKTLINNPSILKLSIVPIALTTVILLILYFVILSYFISEFSNFLPDTNQIGFFYYIGKTLISAFGMILVALIALFLFLPLSSLVCIPFNDIISQKTEDLILGKNLSIETSFIQELIFGVKEGLKLLVFKLIFLAIFFPINFIPTIGNLAYLFLLSIAVSIDFLDLIMTRKKYTLSEKIVFIKNNFLPFVAFSVQFIVFFWIPIIQIFLIPCAAIAGTRFFIEANKR